MRALELVAGWDVPYAAAAVVTTDGEIAATTGDVEHVFRLASLTKVVTGWTVMVAVEEGTIGLDDPVGQAGCTLRHLLAHAGGYPTEGSEPIAKPGRRRIYSNVGTELAANAVAERADMPFAEYLAEATLQTLGMASSFLADSPAHGLYGSVADIARLLAELQQPRLLSAQGAAEAVSIQFPDLTGIVPGVGRFDPCPWGLGIEIRGDKSPHWTGSTNSPETYGHFGASGTMMWVDPSAGCGVVALTDRPFDDWPEAVATWRDFSDAVVAETAGAGRP